MNPADALAILKQNEIELRRLGVAHVALFGSTVRGEATTTSDLDVLVDIDAASQMGMWQYASLVGFLRDLFPVPVDVANRAALKEAVRPSAERDAVYAF